MARTKHGSNRLLRQSEAETEETHEREPRRRIPLGKMVVTIVGLLLTAWFLPALSHQWQDRQRAREVQAALITKIGRSTTDAIVTSQALVAGRLPHTQKGGFDQTAFNTIDLDWQRARAEIEAQIEAYFPDGKIRKLWREYSEFVHNTYWLASDRCFQRDATIASIKQLVSKERAAQLEALRNPFTILDAAKCREHLVIPPDTPPARRVYFFASREVLYAKAQVTKAILRTHLAGFSTRPSDLLRDLVPGT